jgi:hypothetical protein
MGPGQRGSPVQSLRCRGAGQGNTADLQPLGAREQGRQGLLQRPLFQGLVGKTKPLITGKTTETALTTGRRRAAGRRGPRLEP